MGDPDTAESTLLPQLALMIVGGDPSPKIKLITMSGILGPRTCGLKYLLSLHFGEGFILFPPAGSTEKRGTSGGPMSNCNTAVLASSDRVTSPRDWVLGPHATQGRGHIYSSLGAQL